MMFRVINDEGKALLFYQSRHAINIYWIDRWTQIITKRRSYEGTKIIIDSKIFWWSKILHDIDISKIRLVSNTEGTKRVGMIGYGLEITEYVKY
jgi:3,4-dihydroxy 2-butanone 4-phosphate synthase/GTP cyclohydrolase II